jgi:hypothetical protein
LGDVVEVPETIEVEVEAVVTPPVLTVVPVRAEELALAVLLAAPIALLTLLELAPVPTDAAMDVTAEVVPVAEEVTVLKVVVVATGETEAEVRVDRLDVGSGVGVEVVAVVDEPTAALVAAELWTRLAVAVELLGVVALETSIDEVELVAVDGELIGDEFLDVVVVVVVVPEARLDEVVVVKLAGPTMPELVELPDADVEERRELGVTDLLELEVRVVGCCNMVSFVIGAFPPDKTHC